MWYFFYSEQAHCLITISSLFGEVVLLPDFCYSIGIFLQDTAENGAGKSGSPFLTGKKNCPQAVYL
jgi:hypothetical protein